MSRDPVPGTHEPDFIEAPLVERGGASYDRVRNGLLEMGARGIKFYTFGECRVIMAREPAGANHERLWHLTISSPKRHPTWDEIKTARYRLLPRDRCFGMLLPPPEMYVNVAEQDHVFHLWEVTDPREPWSAM